MIAGSAHFVFEEENCAVPAGKQARFDELPEKFFHLYLAMNGKLAAVICISDPLLPEATAVVKALRSLGLQRIVMLTGNSEHTAAAIAAQVGVDEYRSEVLPEDKAHFAQSARVNDHKVIMLGTASIIPPSCPPQT